MRKNFLLFIGFVFILGCTQNNKTQEKQPFSNDYLIGEFSSQKKGPVELKIVKKGEGYFLSQPIDNNKWSDEESLKGLSNEQLVEKFGENWSDIIAAALTSGMCDYYKLQPGKSAGGVTMGNQPDTEYLSRCFADNYLFKVK
jgi:hypothetical protein